MPEFNFNTRPLYVQVRDLLAQQINSGRWKPGQSLPNEAQIASELGLSIGTVRKALDLLEAEQVVSRLQGRGTFVTDYTHQERALTMFTDSRGNEVEGEKVGKSFSVVAADGPIADRLELAVGDAVLRMTRLRKHKSHPFSLETAYLPARLFPMRVDDMATCRLSTLAQLNGIIIGRATELISTATAQSEDVSELEVAEHDPVLLLDRIAYSDQGLPIEWRLARCNVAQLRLVVNYR